MDHSNAVDSLYCYHASLLGQLGYTIIKCLQTLELNLNNE